MALSELMLTVKLLNRYIITLFSLSSSTLSKFTPLLFQELPPERCKPNSYLRFGLPYNICGLQVRCYRPHNEIGWSDQPLVGRDRDADEDLYSIQEK